MVHKTIWVIDDDIIYKTIMKKIIQKSEKFSKTLTFSNGEEGINALKSLQKNNEQLPDIILLDIDMPVMDGWGFMSEIELLIPLLQCSIPIYISSSSIAIEDKLRAKNNPNILGYMSKPISLEDLILIASCE